ncbi:hypothetical protein SDC9_78664 [bioreactor metagenome]|uniref:Uncharacterized protein n=1 Tax=bioreactor metagenome TaxID=1076179 RepID=A0A644YU49_9ZZZZ
MRSSHNCSNFARVSVFTRCFGTPSTGMIYGRLISEELWLESSILAFSAASFSLCRAIGSFRRSRPLFSDLNSSASQSMIFWSKSSPPRCVSPLVDLTSNTPSPSSSMEISKVPPPRSNTATFVSLCCLSSPYARAAAVGSLMMRLTLRPAISPASFVACLWESLK